MARFECFSRTQRPDMDLLPIATEALQSQGFKVRSAIGESISLVTGMSFLIVWWGLALIVLDNLRTLRRQRTSRG